MAPRPTRFGSIRVAALVLAVSAATPASATVGRWNSIGPSYIDDKALGTAGVLFSIALDPTNPETMYVGSHHTQGVFKTTDGGGSWVPITDALPSLAIAALAVDPSVASRVYVALPNAGVFRSENGGADWQQLPGSPSHLTDCCDTLAIHATSSDVPYLTSLDGVYRSIDRGATWQLVNNTGQATALVMHPNNAQVLYAGIVNQGVLYTADGGDNWTLANFRTGAPGIRSVSLALSTGAPPLFPETLYALALTNSDRRILRSLDGDAADASGNRGVTCCTIAVPLSSAQSAQTSIQGQAAAAKAFCLANAGATPAGFFVVGDGPVIGPKQSAGDTIVR